MRHFLVRALLRLYPTPWLNEYGQEFEELLLTRPLRPAVVFNVAWNALRERGRIINGKSTLLRWLLFMAGGSIAAFAATIISAAPLWLAVSAPLMEALRNAGVQQPTVIQDTPWEGISVFWLKLPLLIVAYPWVLFLVWIFFASDGTQPKKRWATKLVICSGGLFLVSGIVGIVAWQLGGAKTLIRAGLAAQYSSTLRTSDCFGFFAKFMLGFGVLLQAPLWARFWWRYRQISEGESRHNA